MVPRHNLETASLLTVAAGRLDELRCLVDGDCSCADLMRQLATVQGTLRHVLTLVFRDNLTACVCTACKDGLDDNMVDDLISAMRYDRSLLDGRGVTGLLHNPVGVGTINGETPTPLRAR